MPNIFKSIINSISRRIDAKMQPMSRFVYKSSTQYVSERESAEKALKEGNWSEYLKYSDPTNQFIDYGALAVKVSLMKDHSHALVIFKKLEAEGLSRCQLGDNFYLTSFSWSIQSENTKIPDYIFNNQNLNFQAQKEIREQCLQAAIENNNEKVMMYLLYDKQMSVSEDFKDKLRLNNEMQALSKIEKRDLLMNLEKNLPIKSPAKLVHKL